MHIAAKTNETNTENKSFKKARCIYLFPSVLYFALHIYFTSAQECAKCDQT